MTHKHSSMQTTNTAAHRRGCVACSLCDDDDDDVVCSGVDECEGVEKCGGMVD